MEFFFVYVHNALHFSVPQAKINEREKKSYVNLFSEILEVCLR